MDWTILKKVIDENDSFLITSHVRPDADALGSELGLRAILLALGKKVSIVNASAPPANLNFMNPPGVILKLNDTVAKANIPKTDVVVIVDTSAWQQLGNMADVIQSSSAKRVVIDHHVSSDEMGAIELKDVTAAATGELICEAAAAFGIEFDEDTANWLYAAIATDTGWFRFPTTSRTMRISAALIDRGASPHYVFNLVHEQSSLSRVRLGGRGSRENSIGSRRALGLGSGRREGHVRDGSGSFGHRRSGQSVSDGRRFRSRVYCRGTSDDPD